MKKGKGTFINMIFSWIDLKNYVNSYMIGLLNFSTERVTHCVRERERHPYSVLKVASY